MSLADIIDCFWMQSEVPRGRSDTYGPKEVMAILALKDAA
jgi:hypothetical protein